MFMQSYSYCATTDICLEDAWNYYNLWCSSGWVSGWLLDIKKDCFAKETPALCPKPLVSSRQRAGPYFMNSSYNTLQPG